MEDTNSYIELLNDSHEGFKALKEDFEIQKKHLQFLIDRLGNVTEAMESMKSAVTESESKRVWKNETAYRRILEILEDYWVTEPNEEYVVVHMYFKKSNGEEQTKKIVWDNPLLAKDRADRPIVLQQSVSEYLKSGQFEEDMKKAGEWWK